MQFMKKYINLNLFFVMSLFLYSLPVMSAEFSFREFEEVSQEVVQTTKSFSEALSEVVTDNPIIMPVAGVAVVAGLIFCGRKPISNCITKQCDTLMQVAQKRCTEAEAQLKKEFEAGAEKLTENSRKNQFLLFFLRSSISGLNYVKDNQWYMTVGALVYASLGIIGHSHLGAGTAAGILFRGWQSQDTRVLRKDIADFREENKKLNEEIQTRIKTVDQDVKNLSVNLAVTGKAIQDQVSNLDIKLSGNLEKAGENLKAFGIQLKDASAQIVRVAKDLESAQENLKEIKGSNAEIREQNNKAALQIQTLSQQLTSATDQFVSTKQHFVTLGEAITAQVKQVAEETKKQNKAIENLAEKQEKELQRLRLSEEKRFEQLFERVKESDLLLKSFEKIQQSNGEQLAELLEDSKECDARTSNAIAAIIKSQEESACSNAKVLTDLNEIRRIHSDSFDVINTNVTSLDKRYAELRKEVEHVKEDINHIKLEAQVNENKREQAQKELSDKINANHNETLGLFKIQETRHKETSESLQNSLRSQSDTTNQMWAQIFALQNQVKMLEQRLQDKIEESKQEVKKQLEEQFQVAVDTNHHVKATYGIALGVTGQQQSLHNDPYPLSVPINLWDQDHQSSIFPSGKKTLPDPIIHVRQPSSGNLGLLEMTSRNPKTGK